MRPLPDAEAGRARCQAGPRTEKDRHQAAAGSVVAPLLLTSLKVIVGLLTGSRRGSHSIQVQPPPGRHHVGGRCLACSVLPAPSVHRLFEPLDQELMARIEDLSRVLVRLELKGEPREKGSE